MILRSTLRPVAGPIRHWPTSPNSASRTTPPPGGAGIKTKAQRTENCPSGLLCHFRYVHIKASLRQERGQRERLESIAVDFGVTVNSRFALNRFPASFHLSKKRLCLCQACLAALRSRYHGFRSIGADQLRPISFEQLRAGENIGPDDASIDRNHHSDRLTIAQLCDQALIVVFDRLGNLVDFFFYIFVLHHAGIRTRGAYLVRIYRRGSCCYLDRH